MFAYYFSFYPLIPQPGNGIYEIPGMFITVSLEKATNELLIKGGANTTGWICIGFNDNSGIVGADLKMLAIIDGELICSDRKTLATGDYPEDLNLGGINNINNAEGAMKNGKFDFSFTIPLDVKDTCDQKLINGDDLWIIMAYALAPEFEHHSRIRKHFKFKFPS